MTNLERREWDLWQEICEILKTSGIVTAADLRAPNSMISTPGERLLSKLRYWGELKAELVRVKKGERQ